MRLFLTAVVAAIGLTLVLAQAALAHTVNVSATCGVVTLNLVDFADKPGNEVEFKVWVNGVEVKSGIHVFDKADGILEIEFEPIDGINTIRVEAKWDTNGLEGEVFKEIEVECEAEPEPEPEAGGEPDRVGYCIDGKFVNGVVGEFPDEFLSPDGTCETQAAPSEPEPGNGGTEGGGETGTEGGGEEETDEGGGVLGASGGEGDGEGEAAGTTTETAGATPTGGVSAGAGGTADAGGPPLALLAVVGGIIGAAGAAFVWRRRSQA